MERIPLNLGWQRLMGEQILPMFMDASQATDVDLPDDFVLDMPRQPQAERGEITGFYTGGKAIYTKELDIPASWAGKTVLLDLDGVYMNAEVSVNGNLLALHPYGYAPMLLSLEGALKPGEKNTLSIAAQSRLYSSRWYSGGGIYREVNLWVGGPCRIEPWDYQITTPAVSPEASQVAVSLRVKNSGAARPATLQGEILDADGAVAARCARSLLLQSGETPSELNFTVAPARLWDDLEPSLYTLVLTLSPEGQAPDVTTCTFGIREIVISGTGMRVNGRSVKLRGGCIHHDNALLGARAYPRAEERKIALLKEAGYNAIRTAHNPPSRALLDACDRLGMYVLDETFDCWRNGKFGLDYHLYFEDWWERDTAWTILRDRNHPSIYCWSCGNEIPETDGTSQGLEWLQKQVACIRSLDATRPVTCGGMFPPIDKVKSIPAADDDDMGPGAPPDFHPTGPVSEAEQAQRAALAQALVDSVDILSMNYCFDQFAHLGRLFPGKAVQSTESQAFFAYDGWKAVERNPHALGEFTWTAYDNLGEAGAGRIAWSREELLTWLCGDYPWLSCYQGDLDLDGRRRPQSYYRKILWGLDQGIHLFVHHPAHTNQPYYGMGWHWADVRKNWTFDAQYIGQPVKLEAYADCDEVAFYINGVLAGTAVPHKLKARLVVPYTPGRVEAVALRGGQAAASDRIETTGAPAQLLLEADSTALRADGMDLSFVTIRVADAAGRTVITDDVSVSAAVSGAGALAGLGSGNPCTPENYGTGTRRVFGGYALACLRAGTVAGPLTLIVSAPGLGSARLRLDAV